MFYTCLMDGFPQVKGVLYLRKRTIAGYLSKIRWQITECSTFLLLFVSLNGFFCLAA